MSAEARAHYDRGLALYGDKDYAGAIRELEAGYAIAARREFLFAEAQALRLSGDCKNAVPLYKRFLASEPEEVQVNATHVALARCAEQMAASATPDARATPREDATRATTIAATPTSPAAPPARGAWYGDTAGGVLLGAGVLGVVTGTVFTMAALSARDDANQSAQSYADYTQRWDTARGRSRIAAVAFATGGVLTGVAVFRYWRVRSRAATPAATLSAWATPDGPTGGIACVGGRF